MPYRPTGRSPGRPKRADWLPDGSPNLTEAQRKALDHELRYARERLGCGGWLDEWPSNASARRVAKLAGVTHRTVLKWRKSPAYAHALLNSVSEAIAKWLETKDQEDRKTTPYPHTKERTYNLIATLARRHRANTGEQRIQSPIDGLFYTAEDYAQHITDNGLTLRELVPKPKPRSGGGGQ